MIIKEQLKPGAIFWWNEVIEDRFDITIYDYPVQITLVDPKKDRFNFIRFDYLHEMNPTPRISEKLQNLKKTTSEEVMEYMEKRKKEIQQKINNLQKALEKEKNFFERYQRWSLSFRLAEKK